MVIEVIYSKALSLGLGIPVLEAARNLKETLSFEAALARAKDIIRNMEIYFAVATPGYLKRRQNRLCGRHPGGDYANQTHYFY